MLRAISLASESAAHNAFFHTNVLRGQFRKKLGHKHNRCLILANHDNAHLIFRRPAASLSSSTLTEKPLASKAELSSRYLVTELLKTCSSVAASLGKAMIQYSLRYHVPGDVALRASLWFGY